MFEKRIYSAAAAAALAIVLGAASDVRAEKLGEGMVMYFQMGGVPGGGATLPRTKGARDAAEAFGVALKEQYSAWQPEKMLNQFREAAAADPACIEIMGHPGNEAFEDLVAEARGRGIVVTSGNAPLTKLFELHQMGGFGYAGVDLYTGGWITGKQMIAHGGLKAGDRALVYGLLKEGERGLSTKGIKEALEEGGLKVDYLEISPEVNADPTLVVPVLTAAIARHPDLKAIGTQHGMVTSFFGKILKDAGKKPGEIITGGIDLAPATIDGLKEGYVSVVLDQQLYLQGFLPVVQCVLAKKYGFSGLNINTGAGVVTPKTIDQLVPLIEAGIR